MICARAGLVQEPAGQVAQARAPPHQRQLGLQQGGGRLWAPVQRPDAAVPRGEPGRLRLLNVQQLGRQGALPLPRQELRLGPQHPPHAQPVQVSQLFFKINQFIFIVFPRGCKLQTVSGSNAVFP